MAARPDWVPENFRDGESWKVDDFGKHYAELASFKAQADERLKDIPDKPEAVKLELPADFKVDGLPEGATVQIDDKDPRAQAFRDYVVKNKLTNAQASQLLAIEASRIADEAKADAAELKKLGDKGADRVTNVDRFMKANMPAARYEAIRAAGDLRSAAAVEWIEDMMAKLASAGVAPNRPNEPPPEPPRQSMAERWYGGTTPPRKAN